MALDQSGPSNERRLAIVDKNRDLYLTTVRVFGTGFKFLKLGNVLYFFLLINSNYLSEKLNQYSKLCLDFKLMFPNLYKFKIQLEKYLSSKENYFKDF